MKNIYKKKRENKMPARCNSGYFSLTSFDGVSCCFFLFYFIMRA